MTIRKFWSRTSCVRRVNFFTKHIFFHRGSRWFWRKEKKITADEDKELDIRELSNCPLAAVLNCLCSVTALLLLLLLLLAKSQTTALADNLCLRFFHTQCGTLRALRYRTVPHVDAFIFDALLYALNCVQHGTASSVNEPLDRCLTNNLVPWREVATCNCGAARCDCRTNKRNEDDF